MYNIPRKESNSSNCSNLFTTPVDLYYNNEHSEEDEVMSYQETSYLNDMLKDYCGNDEYEHLSYKKNNVSKTSFSTNDISLNNIKTESFESLRRSLNNNYVEDERIKISKKLKDDWKSQANSFKHNNLVFLKDSIKIANNGQKNQCIIDNTNNKQNIYHATCSSDAYSSNVNIVSKNKNLLNNNSQSLSFNNNCNKININVNFSNCPNNNLINKKQKLNFER